MVEAPRRWAGVLGGARTRSSSLLTARTWPAIGGLPKAVPLLLLHGKTDSREVCVTAGLLASCA